MPRSLKRGDRVVACPGGAWAKLIVVRELDDGTYRALPEGGDSTLDIWDGITRDEISLDEAKLWPAVFDRLRGKHPGVSRDDVRDEMARSGATFDDAKMQEIWAARCTALFPGFDVHSQQLTREQAYAFFLSIGVYAKSMTDQTFDPSRELFKLYWNGVRMGGRDPKDAGQRVGMKELLAALELTKDEDHPKALKQLAAIEKKSRLKLPATLTQLWAKSKALAAIGLSHCNAPDPQKETAWVIRKAKDDAWGHSHAARIMLPHQGDHAWWAVFDDGADDAEIWLSFEPNGSPVRRVSRTLPFFFWDLAETGRCWKLVKDADDDLDDLVDEDDEA